MGGTWFLSPAQTAPGAPFYLTASVAGKAGSLRHCGGTRRRCGSNPTMLCGKTQKQPVRLDELFLNVMRDQFRYMLKIGKIES